MSVKVSYDPPKVSVKVGAPTVGVVTGNQTVREYVNAPPYRGEYVVTPSEETQMLSTGGCRMNGDVVVNAIPSNYGRLDWTGTTLIVY